jgi:NAD(P)-dependent dehydrogenase (short-subunit alcohol dehydrogenase family)
LSSEPVRTWAPSYRGATMANRMAVVTGGSSGLGLAIAERLSSEGIAVSIIGRDPQRVRGAVDRLRAAGSQAHGLSCDVSRQDQVRAAIQEFGEFGRIEFLFNVAGVGRFGPPEDLSESAIDEVLAGNLKGLMIVTASVLPILRANDGGTIVSVLSSAALVGRPDEAAYCAAKWGARGFMEALRAALRGSSIRTLTVYPGGMRTPFWSAAAGKSPDVSTYMDPRDVARQILRVVLSAGGAHVTEMTIARA